MSKTLILFDFDGTLTKGDTFHQFIFFSKGYLKGLLGYLLFSPSIFFFLLKGMSGARLKEKLVAYFFKDETEEVLKKQGEKFIEHLKTRKEFNSELVKKLEDYKKSGETISVVSASLDVWIKPFCDKYDISCLCTELKFEEGICLGRFNTPNCNNEEKAIRINKFYNLKEYSKIVAYGNSSGDKAMFNLATEFFLIRN